MKFIPHFLNSAQYHSPILRDKYITRFLSQRIFFLFLVVFLWSFCLCGWAQEEASPLAEDASPVETPSPPKEIAVQPTAPDEQIAMRLRNILQATEWFEQPQVRVKEGIVFLQGATTREEHRVWAGNLARNTQSVVAVVNRIILTRPPLFDWSPALEELHALVEKMVQAAPFIGFGLIVLLLSWFASRFTSYYTRRLLRHRIGNNLLREVTTKTCSILVFLLGLYLVLRVSGLTRLAVTILGGTGVAGLIIGIAFRDIMENFLASILLSMQQPFHIGDAIEVAGHKGLVQQVTMRGTVLMDFEGNHIQIPNATIYKAVIRNYTANPKRRSDFIIGIGYEEAITQVQEVARQVLISHSAVLDDPEPLVLVENLGAATVNLRLYFWFDGVVHDERKVRSALIRLVKRAFQQAGISMPDDAREVVFPAGVPIRMLEQQRPADLDGQAPPTPPNVAAEAAAASTLAEGNLRNEEAHLQEQAQASRLPEGGENLLQE